MNLARFCNEDRKLDVYQEVYLQTSIRFISMMDQATNNNKYKSVLRKNKLSVI